MTKTPSEDLGPVTLLCFANNGIVTDYKPVDSIERSKMKLTNVVSSSMLIII